MATMASLETAQQLYVAYYGRPADVEGLIFWATRFDETDDLTETLSAFGSSPEFLDNYGHLENEALIHSLYQQMFNRNADSEGLAFYLDRLETGVASLASIAKQIIDGTGYESTDANILLNKTIQATCLTDQISQGEVIENPDEILDAVGIEIPECGLLVWPQASTFSVEEIILTGISITDNSTMSFDL